MSLDPGDLLKNAKDSRQEISLSRSNGPIVKFGILKNVSQKVTFFVPTNFRKQIAQNTYNATWIRVLQKSE